MKTFVNFKIGLFIATVENVFVRDDYGTFEASPEVEIVAVTFGLLFPSLVNLHL